MRVKSKRGSSALEFIGAAVIILLVVFFGVYFLGKIPGLFNASTSCESNGGVCSDSMGQCPENYRLEAVRTCSENGKSCCMPNFIQESELARFSTVQRTALSTPIFLTLGNNPAAVSEILLNEGEDISAELSFNDKLPEKAFGPVLVYVTDASGQSGTGLTEKFFSSGSADSPDSGVFRSSVIAEGPITSMTASGIDLLDARNSIRIQIEPRLKHVYRKLTMRVVVFDKQKLACRITNPPSKDSEAWLDCLNKGTAPVYVYSSDKNDELKALMEDPTYLLASKSYKITVKPVLELSGVSGAWVADDTVSVKANKPGYSDLSVALVNARTMTGMSQIIEACQQDVATATATRTHFVTDVTNIVGTTTETNGIPLNLNIGGFRIPTATVQLKYLTTTVKPKIVNDKGDIKIDKSTMVKDFYENGGKMEDLFTGQNAYLCVRARNAEKNIYAYAISTSPLKVDVLPPATTQDEIQVVYPELTINTPAYSQQYPSIAGRDAFFRQYPKVVIPCQDYGQSGCASYDYYLKTGNFVNVQATSTDWRDAVTALALQFGINALFNELAKLDPEKTICPYLHSNEFRRNSQPSISVRTAGQTIMCIRIKDNVGNARLVWKEIYSPKEMLERTAVEAANEGIQAATNAASN